MMSNWTCRRPRRRTLGPGGRLNGAGRRLPHGGDLWGVAYRDRRRVWLRLEREERDCELERERRESVRETRPSEKEDFSVSL